MTAAHLNMTAAFNHEEMATIIGWENQASSPIVRRNRTQIMETFPLLLPSLAIQRSEPEHIALTAAIDGGCPLVDAIASLAKVQKKTVRFLRGKTPSQIGKIWIENPFQLLRAVDALPDHLRPQTAAAWRLMTAFWQYSVEATRPSHHKTNCYLEELGWHLFVGFFTAGEAKTESALRRYLTLADCWQGFSDFVCAIRDWCENQARFLEFNNAVAKIAKDKIAIDLLTRYPAIKLIEMSEQWRHAVVRGEGHAAAIAHWPPLLTEPVACNGLSVVSLTDCFQLNEEGRQLNHCVSTYARACLLGHSHILSIRDGSGKPLSTAEVALIEDKCGDLAPVVLQHRGRSNCEADSYSTEALATALRTLAEFRKQTWFRKIGAALTERKHEIIEYLSRAHSNSALGAIDEVIPRRAHAENWLLESFIREELWHSHQVDLFEEAAARVGLEDLFCQDAYELWLDDPYRWAQYERLTGREQGF